MRHDAVGASRDGAIGISWMAARVFNEAAWKPTPDGWNRPDLSGIGGLLHAVGSEAEGWLGQLDVSAWFCPYVPRPDDLDPGEVAKGRWSVPPTGRGVGRCAVEAADLPAALPVAY